MWINIYRGQIEINDLKNDPNDLNRNTKIDMNDPNIFNHNAKNNLELRLIEAIRRNPEMTQKDLGVELSVSAATIKRTLMKMKQEGKFVREGSTAKENGFYLIKSKKQKIRQNLTSSDKIYTLYTKNF